MRNVRYILLVAVGLLASAGAAAAFDPIVYSGETPSIRLELIGRYDGGTFSTRAVQTAPGFDPDSHRLYVGSKIRAANRAAGHRQSVQSGQGPQRRTACPSERRRLLRPHSCRRHSRADEVQRRHRAFFDEDGDPAASPVSVGAQPSMLAFTPDAGKIVVANTGEATDDYSEDPEGSVSIIRLRKRWYGIVPEVSTINFREWNSRGEELRQAGVRLFGPNATVAQESGA